MSKEMRGAMRAALRASSRATVRPAPKPYSSSIDQQYRMQMRQVEELLGLHPKRKEGWLSQLLGGIGGLIGWGFGLMVALHVLVRI